MSHVPFTTTHRNVTFESGMAREFDLVAGADGLHSRVRELVFGAQGLRITWRPRIGLAA